MARPKVEGAPCPLCARDNLDEDRHHSPMSTHSLAEAQESLPDLIRRALDGEEVLIGDQELPSVALTPVGSTTREAQSRDRPGREDAELPRAANDLDWLRRHRVGRAGAVDAATLVRQMRDEGY
jgi:antitoxin (DNA-binding transcriptional repressor) of toxin-antitoxin stability system